MSDANPIPAYALNLLHHAACGDTGGSQAARYFLFWLVGRDDPTGFNGEGALEVRRLDPTHLSAAQRIFTWWTGPTTSDGPLYEILSDLERRFQRASRE